ncbi:MAG: ATP-dependent helicase [Lachnospiraceae bacterium]|nr:ATP-dependent helicase [Lachnospiraceae bacterium]
MYSDLDPSQREAVCRDLRPCEIIAGPGSGKTTVLTSRILYLLDHCQFNPSQILVLTFSRSAAVEMKERFLKRAGDRNRSVRFGTFHSVFFHILKESTRKDYSILGQAQRDRLLEHLLKNHYPDENDRPTVEETEKMLRRPPSSFSGRETEAALQKEYRAYLKENGYLDFDDMISECSRLLKSDQKVRDHWRSMFRAILVDEFQDVNRQQYEILKILSTGEGLFVVGDDDQSIYGFRGSTPTIMRQFMEDYPDAERIFLGFNYRCSASVCKASALMIGQNKVRVPKEIRAVRPPGDKVVLRSFRDDGEEYRYLRGAMRALSREELDLTAVIVRTNTHVARISSYLAGEGIPCLGSTNPPAQITSAAIRDIEAYQQLALELKGGALSRSALLRILNRPERYLLRSALTGETCPPEELLLQSRGNPAAEAAVRDLLKDLHVLGSLTPEGFMKYLMDAVGYAEWAVTRLGEKETVEAALRELVRAAGRASDLRQLPQVLRRIPEQRGAPAGKGVRVMTMHACKGLEFDRVYLPALNEGIIPGRRCTQPQDFEEERRLLYVAMTRARDHLELLYVTGTRENPRPPSRFLSVYGVRGFVSL